MSSDGFGDRIYKVLIVGTEDAGARATWGVVTGVIAKLAFLCRRKERF